MGAGGVFCFWAAGSQGPPGDKVESNDEGIVEEKGHAHIHAFTDMVHLRAEFQY